MKTIASNIEVLDSDEGYCSDCKRERTVLAAVVYTDWEPGHYVELCRECISELAR